MASDPRRIKLLEADPDFGQYLTPEERDQASALTVPCVDVPQGAVDIPALLKRNGAFGAFVLDGMLAAHLRVGEQAGMRIIGPGDVVSGGAAPTSMLLADSGYRAAVVTRLAILGRDLLVGAHRWPRLIAGLHVRTAEQIERVAVQLAICQLPRVEDRLLALFWLLAESWGRVTSSGTLLPLALTHETLGALVGARRPTVTLALGELSQRGAVLRQGKAWLLVEHPPTPSSSAEDPHVPAMVSSASSVWGVRRQPDAPRESEHEAILSTVARLREEHVVSSDAIGLNLQRIRASRLRSRELRERVRAERDLRSRSGPSGG